MLSDEDFHKLLQCLDRPWAGYRKVRKGVKKRIRRHMEEIGCRSIEHYLKQLRAQPEVKAACEKCLYVTISRFFRDRRLWRDMEERLLPKLIRKFEAPLRIWSAGCAGGEEPYSIAIVFSLIEHPSKLALLATDNQPACLDRARKGRFGRSSLKEIPDTLRSEYFVSQKGGRQFKIKPEKISPIHWQQHNLLSAPPPAGPFHMIFLRNNLLTYHRGPELLSAFNRIASVLVPGGCLVVGSHEAPPDLPTTFIGDRLCPWVYHKKEGT